jgi:hypothetical protein
MPNTASNYDTFHLGLDLDGLFADFNGHPDTHGFSNLLVKVTERDLFPRPWTPTTWHWWGALGYKPSEGSAAWEVLKASGTFWRGLPAYPGTREFFRALNAYDELDLRVTFITTRMGAGAHYQSRAWLQAQGMYAAQVVLAANSEAKGMLAQALALDAYVDDYPPNVAAIRAYAPSCDTRLYAMPWNQDARDATTIEGLPALEAWILERLTARKPGTLA